MFAAILKPKVVTKTQWTLTVITVYLLSQPETLKRLSDELRQADANSLPWFSLEKLPYLNAVISEGLRLSYGVSSRLPRIAPDETLVYRGHFRGQHLEYLIPPGTPIGMSNGINHHNEEVFTESTRFLPERWLNNDDVSRHSMESSLTGELPLRWLEEHASSVSSHLMMLLLDILANLFQNK